MFVIYYLHNWLIYKRFLVCIKQIPFERNVKVTSEIHCIAQHRAEMSMSNVKKGGL